MNRRNIIITSFVAVVILSVLSIVLPDRVARVYTPVIQGVALFTGFILGQRVAGLYSKDLKKSFFFLSLFLLLYTLANISIIWEKLLPAVGDTAYLAIINVLQVADYAMLITSCVYTLKVIDIKRINRIGWIVLGAVMVFCAFIIVNGIPGMINILKTSPVDAISLMVIRIFDMAIILMLVPVVLLYLQYLKSKAQESLTFSFIMGGVIISLLSTYFFELAGISMAQISTQYFQKGSLLDVFYIMGYLLIAIGLYANMKYDEWGYRDIERALG